MNKLSSYILLTTIAFLSMIHMDRIHADSAYVQASSHITQTPTSGAGSLVKMESVDAIKNFELFHEKNKLICKQKGLYYAIAVGQVGSTSPGALGYVDCWFAKNGKEISNSNNRQTVESSTYTGNLITQFIIDLDVGDTLGVNFSASGPSLGFLYIKPDNEPGIPSFTISISKIE